jgi:hypothetical protein
MNLALASLAVTLLAAEPEKMDVADKKPSMRVYTDGKNHYFIAQVDKDRVIPEAAWYGDGKAFYKLRSSGGGGDRDSWSMTLWEPRQQNSQAFFEWRDNKGSIECVGRKTEMKQLLGDEAKKVLDAATFYGPRWQRLPYRLARDDKGNYYFVDKQRDVEGNKDMKLYVGPRGKLKLQQMTNIVSDSMGDIFSTKNGELRLIADRSEYKWVQGKTHTKLTEVPIDENHVMVYTDLGVYERMPLGTPCDDL